MLVEGNRRISTAIKYLTQSTWSHAALHVGDFEHTGRACDASTLIEADMTRGVIATPLSAYAGLNLRVCRPFGLDAENCQRVCRHVIDRLGHSYDLRNVLDLARYLLPVPPVPVYVRRRMLAFGSGDPTRAICSSLIALAFESVRYPVLPRIQASPGRAGDRMGSGAQDVVHIRHHSLYTPRDFDISPYFEVIKPELAIRFDYRTLVWEGDPCTVDTVACFTDPASV